MATMKENKGKKVVDKAIRPEAQFCPAVGDKRKNLSKAIDLENLPSRRREKRPKHKLSKPGVVKPSLLTPTSQQPSVQVHGVDSSIPVEVTPSKTTAPAMPQPSQKIPMNRPENEDLAWERFEKAVTSEDVATCYNMSLRELEHSAIHDLFKATELDRTRVLLEMRVKEVKDDCKG